MERSGRFVFVSTMEGAPWGGSEELWSQAALRLVAMGHAVVARVKRWNPVPARVEKLVSAGIAVHFHDDGTSLLRRMGQRMLGQQPRDHARRWLARLRPDLLVISQGAGADGLRWMSLCREEAIPYVALAHSEIMWPADDHAEELALAYQGARRAYFVSSRNKALLERQIGLRLTNAEIVRNPFNVAWGDPPPWPVTDALLRFACVARLEPRTKGQDLLLDVLSRPRWRSRCCEVALFGDGPCERGLKRLAATMGLGNVFFRGHVEDVRSIWAESHLLLLPSRCEGLPLVTVEAMLCARAAVVTDVGDNAELIVNGVTGFLAAAPVAALLEEAMERAWERRAYLKEMGEAARTHILSRIPQDPVAVFAAKLLECVGGRERAVG